MSSITPLAEHIDMVPVAALGDSIRVVLFDASGNWDDGLVIWWALEDSDGARAYVGLDTRASRPTRYRLFEGARHPNSADCVWIELGSTEEGIIVPLLSRHLDSPELWKQAREHRPFEEFIEYAQKALVLHGTSA